MGRIKLGAIYNRLSCFFGKLGGAGDEVGNSRKTEGTLKPNVKSLYAIFFISTLIRVGLHAQSTPINRDPVILPKYEVTASKFDIEAEQWLYASWNNIEIISNVDIDITNDFLLQMRARLHALESAIPGLRARSVLPFEIILHGPGLTRSQLYGGSGLNSIDRRWFVMNHSGRQIVAAESHDPLRIKHYSRACASQYFRNKTEQYYPLIPLWHLATIWEIIYFSNFDGGNQFDIGKSTNVFLIGNFSTVSKRWQSTARDSPNMSIRFTPETRDEIWDPNVSALSARDVLPANSERVRPMPMSLMFAWKHEDFKRKHKYPDALWANQCYTFWHYCYVRANAGPLKQGYMKLLEMSGDGSITEDVFCECMGMGFADMEKALFEYVGYNRAKHGYNVMKIRFEGNLFTYEAPLRKATQAEVARIKGEALLFQGKFDLARKTMLTVYDRKKADPALCASLGVLEYKAGDLEKARPLLTTAIQAEVPNPEVYRTLARIKLNDALDVKKGGKPAPEKLLTPKQSAEIYALLCAVRRMPPVRAETYALLSEILARSGTQPTEEQASFVEEGKKWFPDGKNPPPQISHTYLP